MKRKHKKNNNRNSRGNRGKVSQMAEGLLPMLQESLGEDAVITACDIPGESEETMHLRVEDPETGQVLALKLRYLPDQGVLELDMG